MKEVIVIFATVILGVAIAAFVIGLDDTAQQLTDGIDTRITQLVTDNQNG